jgi:DNA-binding HxlR family transcriptional regulator
VDAGHVREISRILSHKWDVAILACLATRPRRYNELANEVQRDGGDIAEGVLSKNLKQLAANGLIQQEPIGNHQHTWNLTLHGRHMVEILRRITDLDEDSPADHDEHPPPQEPDPGDDDQQ